MTFAPQTDLLFIETSDLSIESHLDGLLGFLASQKLKVCAMSSDTGRLLAVAARNNARGLPLAMEREPAPGKDLRSLVALMALIRRERPRIVVYGTPKAALLGAIASWACRVPRRVHVLHGLRVETMTGFRRRLFVMLDRLIERLSTETVAVGAALAKKAIEVGSMTGTALVLGHGSAQGIDLERFRPKKHPIGNDGFTVGFVGRITPDKGIDTLCQAFLQMQEHVPNAQLKLFGAAEAVHLLDPATQLALSSQSAITHEGEVRDVAPVLAAMDVFCLPTRREGLPTVVMEAAAMGVPIVATNATGVADIVDEGTAWILPIDDVAALRNALLEVHANPTLARTKAELAQKQVVARFDRELVWRSWLEFLCPEKLRHDN